MALKLAKAYFTSIFTYYLAGLYLGRLDRS